MYNLFHPPPAPPGYGQGKVLPEAKASFPSRLLFQWLSPLLNVGFSRPLEKEDLWELPPSKLTSTLTDRVEHDFYARCPPEKRPLSHRQMTIPVSPATTEKPEEAAEMDDSGKSDKAYDSSLISALHTTYAAQWWTAGIFKLIADTLTTTTPLVSKLLLTWLTEAYVYHRLTDEEKASGIIGKPRGIGYGIGLAFAIFAMQELASLFTNHYTMTGMSLGLSVRTSLIGAIFRKSLRLSARARIDHSVGQISTMISTDTTRLEGFCALGNDLWVAPIQIIIGIALLIYNLGYSALVGLGVLILGFPVQFILVKIIFSQHLKGAKITDERLRLTTDVLQGIRLVKVYAWEAFYANRIGGLRKREVNTIRKVAIATAGLTAMVTFTPILASTLSFITYALSGHDLNVAIIFTALQYFDVIRAPLLYLPVVLAALADAFVGTGRISKFLTAEELGDPYLINANHELALDIDGDFTWEHVGKSADESVVQPKNPSNSGALDDTSSVTKKPEVPKKSKADKGTSVLPSETKNSAVEEIKAEDEQPFMLNNLRIKVAKGSFVAIVGRIGSGKSSVMQAAIGEMRKINGHVTFGGSIAYVPQSPWIRNATLRENVVFGQHDDEQKFQDIIRACSLESDIAMLPHRELTAIGEKGINLSGGQKARVSLARAAYFPSDIVLMDDPLSAVDSHVGKAILDNCILRGPLSSKTRVLVTHALNVLDRTDYIYVMEGGKVTEEGTYSNLMKDGVLLRLIDEHGGLDQPDGNQHHRQKDDDTTKIPDIKEEIGKSTLMADEERERGAVSWSIYRDYLKYAGGVYWAPIILLLLTLSQVAQVGNTLFLGFWTAGSIPGFRQGDYMAVYTGFGVASAVFSFLLFVAFAYAGLSASLGLFSEAFSGVLRSPRSFFDTTPIGRILSRLSKDQSTLDMEIALTLYGFLYTFSSILGTVALVFYTFPYLGIIFAPMTLLYWLFSTYYRRSSVETKRLDSLMRSALYESYTETLTGLATIRSYGRQNQAITTAEHGLDLENRAYYMTITLQRWLGVRLDLFGNILVLGIGLFSAGLRFQVNPSKIGVVLTYALTITQFLSAMVTQFAQNEQSLNAVERMLVYAQLPPEGDPTRHDDPPPPWPEQGGIKFTDAAMAYREGLPLVLKSVNFEIQPGEKVGVVGRTGAGKSSLTQALFRLVELQSGRIDIDGINIINVGLDTLRHRLALVPQDSTLFLGTLRENIDPQGICTDADLISVLQRAWLLPRDGTSDPSMDAKFSLDAVVGDEGSNYSAGEKQLLSLCRALVKNSRIIVLDEATSNVDVETDSRLQKTIQTEFASSTLLCIAHRLNTVAYYDRILVMDDGKIAEFDTVLNLFDQEHSIFRSLCNEAGLSKQDILRIRSESSEKRPSMTPG